jgi:hypothetical protein
VRAQRDEGLLFFAPMSRENLQHGGLEIVVPDAMGHATEKLKRQTMPLEKRFLPLMREATDERGFRIA